MLLDKDLNHTKKEMWWNLSIFNLYLLAKFCKTDWGDLQKNTRVWLQRWRPSYQSRLFRVQWGNHVWNFWWWMWRRCLSRKACFKSCFYIHSTLEKFVSPLKLWKCSTFVRPFTDRAKEQIIKFFAAKFFRVAFIIRFSINTPFEKIPLRKLPPPFEVYTPHCQARVWLVAHVGQDKKFFCQMLLKICQLCIFICRYVRDILRETYPPL